MINACYGSPLSTVALQWYTKVKYMTSMPMSFAIGATVVYARRVQEAVARRRRRLIEDIGKANAKKLRKVIRKANEDAKGTMTRKGVTVVQTPAAMVDEFTKQSQDDRGRSSSARSTRRTSSTWCSSTRDEYRAKHREEVESAARRELPRRRSTRGAARDRATATTMRRSGDVEVAATRRAGHDAAPEPRSDPPTRAERRVSTQHVPVAFPDDGPRRRIGPHDRSASSA